MKCYLFFSTPGIYNSVPQKAALYNLQHQFPIYIMGHRFHTEMDEIPQCEQCLTEQSKGKEKILHFNRSLLDQVGSQRGAAEASAAGYLQTSFKKFIIHNTALVTDAFPWRFLMHHTTCTLYSADRGCNCTDITEVSSQSARGGVA